MEDSREDLNDNVQIKADLKEIRRRIAAFQARKRKEVDESNLQEFCNLPRAELCSEFSCCRVDAVVVQRAGSKGHVKVSRVVNQWGPQTMVPRVRRVTSAVTTTTTTTTKKKDDEELPEGIEERLRNMESHLTVKSGRPVPKDIYSRLKELEDRILFLEGISPDYFADSPRKKIKTEKNAKIRRTENSNMSLDEIEAKIRMLKGKLLQR